MKTDTKTDTFLHCAQRLAARRERRACLLACLPYLTAMVATFTLGWLVCFLVMGGAR